MKRSLMLALSAGLICSCAHIIPVNPDSSTGETARIVLTGNIQYTVELLAINDVELFVLLNQAVCAAPLSDVRSVSIQAYRRTGLSGLGRFLLGVPTVSLELAVIEAGIQTGYPVWSVIAVVGMAGTIYGLSTGMPPVDFEHPIVNGDRAEIGLYCRYPQGLTAEQWRQLLDHLGQEEFVELKPTPPPHPVGLPEQVGR